MKKLLVVLVLVVIVAACVVAVVTLQPAWAKGPCDIAEEYGGHHTFWNLMCSIERLFDYLFYGGEF
jgi:hypothetical protein